jgi:hypothetical protein
MWTDVSKESITSIFMFENQPSKKVACNRRLDTCYTLCSCSADFRTFPPKRLFTYGLHGAISLEDNIHNYRRENLKSYQCSLQDISCMWWVSLPLLPNKSTGYLYRHQLGSRKILVCWRMWKQNLTVPSAWKLPHRATWKQILFLFRFQHCSAGVSESDSKV